MVAVPKSRHICPMTSKKIGANTYINTDKILTARIFKKDDVIKVCFELDTESKEPKVAFSDPAANVAEAETLIQSLSNR